MCSGGTYARMGLRDTKVRGILILREILYSQLFISSVDSRGSPWKETDALPLVPAAACVSESVWLHRKMIFNREDAQFVEKLFYD